MNIKNRIKLSLSLLLMFGPLVAVLVYLSFEIYWLRISLGMLFCFITGLTLLDFVEDK